MAAGNIELPPGFRFYPTDEELVYHYLCKKCTSSQISVPIIAEVDLYKYDPWQLPGMALYGEKEWFFFSPRDRKYPNGSRPNRSAGSGYWKATGADKPIGKPKPVGIKKALVFYAGKAPKGEKTDWIMHEYRLADVDRSARKKNCRLRLDDWVLCRIYNKKGFYLQPQKQGPPESLAPEISNLHGGQAKSDFFSLPLPKQELTTSPLQYVAPQQSIHMDCSDRPHAESSGSDHVPSSSMDFAAEREVQSQCKWGGGELDGSSMTLEEFMNAPFPMFDDQQLDFPLVRQPSSDLLFYLQKPF